jgi:hypothetical protein
MASARVELSVSVEDSAASIGPGHGTARTAPVVRTLGRLVQLGLARHDDALEVRQFVPTLTERQPQVLQAAHHYTVAGSGSGSVPVSYTY